MPPGKQEVQLGDSWVVEVEDESKDRSYSPQDDEYKPPPPRRSSRRGTTSPESELVIPSVDFNSMNGSWADTTSRSTTRARAKQSAERVLETSRRSDRMGNGSPVKRPAAKIAAKEPLPTVLIDGSSSSSSSNNNNNKNSTNLQDIVDVGAAIMSWLLDVFTGALKVLKKPLSYFLAIWLLFGILITVRNLVTNSIYASMSPLCRIPGSSFLNLPFCPVHLTDSSHGATPEFNDLMSVQAKFEEVLEESAGGVSLPLDMKRGEASIRDLRQLVRYSQLQSKNELVLEFDGFIETSRIASYDLQKFNSHVGRAVDSVIATTRWTTRVLDGIQERDDSRGSISAFINDKLLAPFQPVKFTERILLDQYIQHTRIVEEEISNLIAEAQAVLMVLTNLEDRLEVIHGIAIRDDMHTKALKEEILSELWTIVGGNRGKINKMDRKLDLLQQVGIYRKTAHAHVSGTIIRLQAMGAGLEDLRERVGSPELLRDRIDIPLEVHIESITKGVERLEESRLNARKLEDKLIRRTLERGRLEGTTIDG